MKIHKENAIIHKIHLWSSLIINSLSTVVAYAVFYKNYDILPVGAAGGVSLVLMAVIKIRRDMCFEDISFASIVLDYFCMFLISGIFVYKAYEKTSLTVAVILSSFIVLEILIAFTINYRYIIRNKIKQII